MKDMEQKYRAAMRWYTAKWRRRNADALLATLLESAEASGQPQPTRAELQNLHAMGIRQRAFAALPIILFAVALLSLLSVGSLAFAHVAGSSELLLQLPAFPAPRAGQIYTTPTAAPFQAGWAYAIGSVCFVASLTTGLLTLRRNRRLLTIAR
ncbi:MAG TPA: hypothetical protein VHZ81_12745 [Galbitalea sp.]|nr:hypothetical protein [Galbitalea sp.]